MPKFSLVRDSLDTVVKDISVESYAFLVHNGGTKNIAAFTDGRGNRTWEDLQHQMVSIDRRTTIGLDFFRFGKTRRPDCLNSSLAKNSPRTFLCRRQ
jgi:hypothetical protein